MTIQPLGSNGLPVVALDPPPEGLMSSNFACTLTPFEPDFFTNFQLSSAAGLPMSQVVSLFVDNQLNPLAVTIVHGALNEVTTVPANSVAIIPTLSNKSGYAINCSLQSGVLQAGRFVFNIVFSNYMRHKATFNTVLSNTIAGVGNTNSLASGMSILSQITPIPPIWNPLVNILPRDADFGYCIDNIDLAIEGVQPSGAGEVKWSWELFAGSGPDTVFVAQGQIDFNSGTGNWHQGVAISRPFRATYYNGLVIEKGAGLTWTVPLTLTSNTSFAALRYNVSGVQLS